MGKKYVLGSAKMTLKAGSESSDTTGSISVEFRKKTSEGYSTEGQFNAGDTVYALVNKSNNITIEKVIPINFTSSSSQGQFVEEIVDDLEFTALGDPYDDKAINEASVSKFVHSSPSFEYLGGQAPLAGITASSKNDQKTFQSSNLGIAFYLATYNTQYQVYALQTPAVFEGDELKLAFYVVGSMQT